MNVGKDAPARNSPQKVSYSVSVSVRVRVSVGLYELSKRRGLAEQTEDNNR
jgi:hypothetical protein